MTLLQWWILILTGTFFLFVVSASVLGILHQEHHYWYGVYLLALALLLMPGLPSLVLGWIGCALMVDDSMQHAVQLVRPSFRSPLHLLYRVLIYNPTHRQ